MERRFKIFGKEVTVAMRNEGDLAIANELFLDHQYRHCDAVIRGAKTAVIDIGGHLGFFSLYAALLNSQVPIFSFEPHLGNYTLLKENLRLNHVKNVTSKQTAVSDTAGESTLFLSREDLNHSLTHAIEPTGVTQPVQTTTLQRIFEKNRLVSCDLVKIDCEGGEFKILYSTPPEIFARIRHFFIEYHDWQPGESSVQLRAHLEKMGFKVEQFRNSKIPQLGFFWCGNKSPVGQN